MKKLPDCDRCSFYTHSPYLVCAIHPKGVETDKCLDFRRDSNAEKEEQWSPEGYSWYGNELVADRRSRYTVQEQILILDTHPFFTGVCPQCSHEFDRDNLPVHYDCPECDFIENHFSYL